MAAFRSIRGKKLWPRKISLINLRNSEFVSNDCDLASTDECFYLNLNFWADREENKNINKVRLYLGKTQKDKKIKTEVGEVDAAFSKEAAKRNITFEYLGDFPGAETDGLANLNGRKTEDPRQNDASLTIASVGMLLFTLMLS